MRFTYDGFIQSTPATEELDEDMDTSMDDLNRMLDLHPNDEMEYEAKCFASSCVYDASDEIPF